MSTAPVRIAPPKEVTIYTDGACTGNPGPGGYGAVLLFGRHRKELAAGYRRTTNNRMELMACIAALQVLNKPCTVTLYSDSQYVVNGIMEGWAKSWRKNNWRRRGEDVPNADLWAILLDLCAHHHVTFKWVPGHAGIPENERCDQLSVQAAAERDQFIDTGYENLKR